MTTKTILAGLCALGFIPAMAQQELMTNAKYQQLDARTLWHNTDNAAGLGQDRTENHGTAYFDYSYTGGNYHRVQEGSSTNQLRFFTESYQQLSSKLYSYGKFAFNMNHTKERAWADVMRPYNSNPYFSGSSVPGRYDLQTIDLTAAIGTTRLGRWNLGAKLDYNLGDLSRLRDPRSRAELLDYRLTPSAIYNFGKAFTHHTIGLAAWYHRRKEKIGSLTTVQTDANLKYYLMSGMENATGNIRGYNGYQREWVNHNFGVELSYAYKKSIFYNLTSASLQRGSESILGQYKYRPGHFYSYIYGLQSQNRFEGAYLLHQLDVNATFEEAYADEYRQQLIIENDPNTSLNSYHYETLIKFKKRYQVKNLDLGLHYRISAEKDYGLPGFYLGITSNYKQVSNRYLLNTSKLEYGLLNLIEEMGFYWKNWSINTNLGYSWSTQSRLKLADETTDYAKNVLKPDMKYHEANYWHCRLEVMREQPLTIKKMKTNWYAKAYADFIEKKKPEKDDPNKYTLGFSFGILY